MWCVRRPCNVLKLMLYTVTEYNGMEQNEMYCTLLNTVLPVPSSVMQCHVMVSYVSLCIDSTLPNSTFQYINHNLSISKPLLFVDVLKAMDWNCQPEPQETSWWYLEKHVHILKPTASLVLKIGCAAKSRLSTKLIFCGLLLVSVRREGMFLEILAQKTNLCHMKNV